MPARFWDKMSTFKRNELNFAGFQKLHFWEGIIFDHSAEHVFFESSSYKVSGKEFSLEVLGTYACKCKCLLFTWDTSIGPSDKCPLLYETLHSAAFVSVGVMFMFNHHVFLVKSPLIHGPCFPAWHGPSRDAGKVQAKRCEVFHPATVTDW